MTSVIMNGEVVEKMVVFGVLTRRPAGLRNWINFYRGSTWTSYSSGCPVCPDSSASAWENVGYSWNCYNNTREI